MGDNSNDEAINSQNGKNMRPPSKTRSTSPSPSSLAPRLRRRFSLQIGHKKLKLRLLTIPDSHQQPAADKLPFQCHLCTAQFLSPAHWSWHCFILHYGDRPSSTVGVQHLLEPVTNEQGVELGFACPTCPGLYDSEPALRSHIRAGLVVCGLCGAHYCSETLFDMHQCPLLY